MNGRFFQIRETAFFYMRIKSPAYLVIGLLSWSIGQQLGAAEGVRTLPDSAAGMGMIGGRLANMLDPSVTRANPASLPLLRESALMITAGPWHGKTDFNGVDGSSETMIEPWKPLGSMYYVRPVSENVTVGIGFAAPFGLSMSWPRDGPFRYYAPYEAVLQTAALNPAVGFKLNDRVSIGVGLDVFYSRLELSQDYPWALAAGTPVPDGDMNFEGDGWGFGGYMGINFKLAEHHRLALVGRLPVNVGYNGDFSISDVPAALSGVFLPDTGFKTDIEHPASIGIGYGVDLTDKLTLGIDCEWIQNSAHDDLPLNIGSNQPLLPVDRLDLDWRDSYSVGCGLQYQLTPAWVLRAGYLFSKSPLRDRTYTPVIPTNDRHIFSAGVGYTRGRHTFDLAYSFVPMETRTVREASTPAFNGDYEIEWQVFTASYTLRF